MACGKSITKENDDGRGKTITLNHAIYVRTPKTRDEQNNSNLFQSNDIQNCILFLFLFPMLRNVAFEPANSVWILHATSAHSVSDQQFILLLVTASTGHVLRKMFSHKWYENKLFRNST